MEDLIKIKKLSYIIGKKRIINNLSLNIQQGITTGLVGPNGAGKTSLINLLTQKISHKGEISYQGNNLRSLSTLHRIKSGIVHTFQNAQIFEELTVQESVDLIASTNNVSEQDKNNILDLMGIKNMPKQISFGMKRLIAITLALLTNPKILILDEPATGLNSSEIEDLINKIKLIRKRGITLLITDHNIDFISKICDRLIILNNGEKIAEGIPDIVFQNPLVKEVYLGQDQ